jgi:class 3 adenylate cyclase
MTDAAEFEAAGLYDPSAPDAADRLALLEHLDGAGVSVAQMVAALEGGSLHAALTDMLIRPGRVMTSDEVSAATGLSVDLLHRITLAAGVPIRDDGYRESDLDTFRIFGHGSGMFGEELVLQFTRAVGSSMARIADAALSMFLVNVEGPIVQEGGGGVPLAEASEEAVALLDVVPSLMAGLFRLHVQAAVGRQRIANRSTENPSLFRLAVGFVDLVGFTPYTETADPDDLSELVAHFEGRANDVVAQHGGRVVKHIGDEVMFVDANPAVACDAALHLIESFGADTGVAPHAGIGFGSVVARGGDYYGSVVNVASRIADLAVPGEVLVTDGVEAIAADEGSVVFDPAGRRMLKGFAEPIPLWSVRRSRPSP